MLIVLIKEIFREMPLKETLCIALKVNKMVYIKKREGKKCKMNTGRNTEQSEVIPNIGSLSVFIHIFHPFSYIIVCFGARG